MRKGKLIYEIGIDKRGKFLERPNRFVADIKLEDNTVVTCHVHDSGRIRELLFEDNSVGIKKAKEGSIRKTQWDVISAFSDDKEDILINSSYHRYISEKFLRDKNLSPFGDYTHIKAEVKYGDSRIDYLIEKDNEKIWVEVKGVSLSLDKKAMFPDAPSTRAQKHLRELIEIKEKGDRAAVLLLIFRESNTFRPKWETDPKFSELFYEAMEKGVEIYPIQFFLKGGKIMYEEKEIRILTKQER
ncbi:DNA/RNA nuclease SfsA [Fusobacterium sp.]|uniref:DNA/RNA nuclease SfsA n=1 Tax=Fusobacterium sp. TaxID=68766 RepID=UPI0029052273|nr:DNA/RNA nuclease SfsA [Fusobacterium sp.]MDU1911860.1 DNA/RNA nuclease SfsA [Fusobacterium sp.]